MHIRLVAILVMFTASSMILARFNAADEKSSTIHSVDDRTRVAAEDVRPNRWYGVPVRSRVAEISLPEVQADDSLEIVVTAIAGDLRETEVLIEAVNWKAPAQNSLRYAPIKTVECRPEITPLNGIWAAGGERSLTSERPFSGCSLRSTPATRIINSDDDASASRRDFRIPLMSPDGNLGQKITIKTTPVVQTEHVEVYVDELVKEAQPTIDLAVEIAEYLEQRVMPVLNQKIGTPYDVDGSGRLSVVLSPKVPGFTKGKKRVKGFVLPDDIISLDESGTQPNGNYADVIFLDSCLPHGEALVALLTHEFTHVVSLSNARRNGSDIPAMWINEAVAHVGERFCSHDDSNIRHRLQAFHQNTKATPLLLDDESFDHLHRNPAVRGASFSFIEWCVRSADDRLIRELTFHAGETATILERRTDLPFDQLVQQWGLSLAESHRPAFQTIPKKKEPMTFKISGTGNLFLNAPHMDGNSLRIQLPTRSHVRVAFRLNTNSD